MTTFSTPIVPSDDKSIYEAVSTLTSGGQSLALVRPSTPSPGIGGFLFTIPQEDTIDLSSDITDHWSENNRAIQDHIALRPEEITLRGLVGELVFSPPEPSSNQMVQSVTDARISDNGTAPEVSAFAADWWAQRTGTPTSAQAQAASTQSAYGYYVSKVPQPPNKTRQAQIFGYFYQLWLGRQVMTVETPFGIFTSMAIQSLSATQEEGSKWVSEFTIKFKRVRTVTASVYLQKGQLDGRVAFQSEAPKNLGTAAQAAATTVARGAILSKFNPQL
jgi:hypothetical protein